MRYHLFQKFFEKMVKIKEMSFLSTRGMGLMFANCTWWSYYILTVFFLLFTDITVANVVVPHDCNDNPYFANCKLIVKAEYCANVYYKKFCCRSCTDAGQIKHN